MSVVASFDLEAFTTALNRIFQPQGITAVSRHRDDCLQVALVGLQAPDQTAALPALRHQLTRWPSASRVMVIGRQIGQITPSWVHTLELESPGQSAAPQPLVTDTLTLTSPDYQTQDFLVFLGSLGLLLGLGWNFWTVMHQRSMEGAIAPPTQFKRLPSLALPTPSNPSPTSEPEFTPAAAIPPAQQAVQPTLITIKAVGDMVLGTNYLRAALPEQPARLFQSIRPLLQGADILFGNFESTLTNYPVSAKDASRDMVFAFRSPPSYARVSQQVGFDVLSVANNHSYDFDTQGFRDTMQAIQQAGMKPVGQKRQIVYSQVKGVTIAFIGFSYLDVHNQIQDLRGATALVQTARQRADIVVISMHAGAEGSDALRVSDRTELFYGEDRGNKVRFARTMIDNGADLVLGHGPHVARAMELYQGKLIVYSLGNFVGYHTLSTQGVLGQSFVLEAQLDTQGRFVRGKILPVYLDGDGIPHPDPQGRSIQLIRELIQADFPSTPLQVSRTGQIMTE